MRETVLPRGATMNDPGMVADPLSLGCPHPYRIVSAARVVSQNTRRRPLVHEGSTCLVFVVQGEMEIDRDGEPIRLRSNEAVLLAPLRGGRTTLFHEGETEFYLLRFRCPRASTARHSHHLTVPDHVVVRNPGRLKHLLQLALEERRRPAESCQVLHHLAVLMLCELGRSSGVSHVGAPADGMETMASRVDAYIAAHYHEPIGTPDIAMELRYNPAYLERAYRAERHISIREAIHRRRIREARAHLLLERTLAVAQIAALCGYPDPGYFRRVFKRETSLTPHRYRALHAADRPVRREVLGA